RGDEDESIFAYLGRALKMSSQLNKREPDMQPAVKPRSSSVTFFGIAGRTLSALIAFCRGGSLPALVSSRRFIAVALRGASLPERRKPKMASPVRGTIELEARRSEEHTSELQSLTNLVCRLL